VTDINTPAPWRRVWPFLLPLVLLYVVYGSIFIHDSSFVVDGKRVFCLLDDPMISMRYARNLADGLGLVWNAGERVEGITNPGWTFIMALVHLVEHDRTKTSLYMQVISLLCNVVTVILTALLGLKLSGGSRAVAIGAAALTAFYYPANYWSLYGMETGLLAMLITLAVWLYLRPQPRADWPVYLVMGLATIVRFDAVVPLLVIGGYAILTAADWPGRRRHALLLAATLMVFIGGQTVARLMYYGYPLPNTYYLKMTGFPVLQRMARGGIVTLTSFGRFAGTVIAVAVSVNILQFLASKMLKDKLKRNTSNSLNILVLFTSLAIGQLAYSIYVGGDAWEWEIYFNRYLVICVPVFMLIASQTIFSLLPNSNWMHKGIISAYCCIVITITVIAVNINSRNENHKEEAALMRIDPEISFLNSLSYQASTLLKTQPDYHKRIRVACEWAGGLFYFLDCYAIDPLGKCDIHIGHLNVPQSHWFNNNWATAFWPGHMKWDIAYTVRFCKPDYFVLRFQQWVDKVQQYILPRAKVVEPGVNGLIFLKTIAKKEEL